jgi:acetyl esterase/lipase
LTKEKFSTRQRPGGEYSTAIANRKSHENGASVNTRHLVDPELLPVADNFPALNLNAETLPAIRGGFAASLAQQELPDLPVRCSEVEVPSGEGNRTVRCLMIRPDILASGAPAILHFHGGGHVLGTPEMHQGELMRWAAELGCLVLSVDYRLAPETPFPGPMDDAYAALRWLNEQAGELGIDPARLAVAGTSAGGAMAACLCLMARDRGEFGIAFQMLDSPRLDDKIQQQKSGNPCTGEFVWTREASTFCWNAYLGGGHDSPYATAARAKDLSDLPPAFIAVGSIDLFVDECLEYSARLIRSGVSVELIVYPGCFHGFQMAREAAVTKRSQADSLRALARAIKQPGPALPMTKASL